MNRSEFSVRSEPVDLLDVAREAVARHEAAAQRARGRAARGGRGELGRGRPRPSAAGRVEPDRERAARDAARRAPSPSRSRPGRCSVADTGPGIAEDDQPHAFDRFYLYDKFGRGPRRSAAGSGWRSSSSSRRRWAATSGSRARPAPARRSSSSAALRPQLRGVDDLEVGAVSGHLARVAGRSTSAGSARPRRTRASRCRRGSSRRSSSPARRCAPAAAASRCRRSPSAARAGPSAAATDRVELLA